MKPEEWTLLAINAAKEQGLSPVRLQKALFLLGRHLPSDLGESFYSFTPYNYGPFDSEIYEDARKLAAKGFININQSPGQRWVEYQITASGIQVASQLNQAAPQQVVEYLNTVVSWTLSLSFQQLVGAIYKMYPEFKVNSVFNS